MTESDCNESEVTIDGNDELWRRVAPSLVIYDDNLKKHRPNSSAFKNEFLSVYIARLVCDSGRAAEDLLLGKYELNGLVGFTAGFARKLGQEVKYDPAKEGDTDTDPAHGLVIGPKDKRVRHAFATDCNWVVLPEKFR